MLNNRSTSKAKSPKRESALPDIEAETKILRSRHTLHLDDGLMDRARNVVYWTPGLTLSALAEQAIQREVERLEKKHGGVFPERGSELVGGRPLKGTRRS